VDVLVAGQAEGVLFPASNVSAGSGVNILPGEAESGKPVAGKVSVEGLQAVNVANSRARLVKKKKEQ